MVLPDVSSACRTGSAKTTPGRYGGVVQTPRVSVCSWAGDGLSMVCTAEEQTSSLAWLDEIRFRVWGLGFNASYELPTSVTRSTPISARHKVTGT